MKLTPIYFLLILAFLNFTACKKENELVKEEAKLGVGELYFQKGIKEKDANKMLSTFKEGLDKVDTEKDSISLYLLDGIIHTYKRQKNYTSALDFTDSLITTAESQNNTYFVALGYYRKAAVFKALNNSEEVYKYTYKSRELFLQIGDSLRAGQRSLELANAQSRMADYTGSQENATSALKFLLKEKDSAYISSAYNVIAMSYRERGFYDDAIKEYKNALQYSLSTEDSLSFLNNIALAYRDNGNYRSALSTFEGVLDKIEYADEDSKARFIDNYAYTKWMQDSTSPVLDELNHALELRLKTKDLDGMVASYEHLSNYYENTNLDKALKYAYNRLETARNNSSKNSELNALKRILSFSNVEDSKSITAKFIILNDSLQNVQLRAKNTFAKIKYDEEQKEKEINNLEAETINQQLETNQLEDQMLIMSLGSLLILSIGGFILYYFKHKHKKEKLQEVYITETRISKKIHDELANDIYNMMGSLEPIAPPDLLDNLASIYSRTRDISRANSDIDTGENYIAHLLSILSNAAPANAKLIIKGENSINWKNISEEKKIVIYRVLQEFMVNMKKHSTASFVAIIFFKTEKFLNIDYSDNGQGSELSAIKSGNGLKNVENRIISVKGRINFETEKGKGLKTNIQIPI